MSKRTRLQIDTDEELKAAVEWLAARKHHGSVSACVNVILREHLAPIIEALRAFVPPTDPEPDTQEPRRGNGKKPKP